MYDGDSLDELEPILTLESRDLAVGELGQELWFHIIRHMYIVSWYSDLKAIPRCKMILSKPRGKKKDQPEDPRR